MSLLPNLTPDEAKIKGQYVYIRFPFAQLVTILIILTVGLGINVLAIKGLNSSVDRIDLMTSSLARVVQDHEVSIKTQEALSARNMIRLDELEALHLKKD